jgi:hypothetical protein
VKEIVPGQRETAGWSLPKHPSSAMSASKRRAQKRYIMRFMGIIPWIGFESYFLLAENKIHVNQKCSLLTMFDNYPLSPENASFHIVYLTPTSQGRKISDLGDRGTPDYGRERQESFIPRRIYLF